MDDEARAFKNPYADYDGKDNSSEVSLCYVLPASSVRCNCTVAQVTSHFRLRISEHIGAGLDWLHGHYDAKRDRDQSVYTGSSGRGAPREESTPKSPRSFEESLYST